MTDQLSDITQKIRSSAEILIKAKSVYAPIINFFVEIFCAQEASKANTRPDRVHMETNALSAKIREKAPLIKTSEFSVDGPAGEELLKILLDIIKTSENDMSAYGLLFTTMVNTGEIRPMTLFNALLQDDADFFDDMSKTTHIPKSTLAFITYNSIKPSLQICAHQLSVHLEPGNWEKGFCPVCGSPPGISLFEGEGERGLICSFCWEKWRAPRIFCPYCETTDSSRLHYFTGEDEAAARVDCCDQCKKYIKTIDTREMSRYIYPPLEQVSTLHLDMKAKEMGYETGVPERP
jgi:FdhE protein